MKLEKLVREYVANNQVMQLATSKDSQPWLCTVNYVVDEQLNFYWMSMRSRRHSRELALNPKTAGAILQDPHIKRCLHFEGTAQEIDSNDLERVHNLYGQAYGNKPERLEEARSPGEEKRTYYVLKPTLFVLFDEINFPDNPRQEYKLSS